MGLSNQERIKKITWSLYRINQRVKTLSIEEEPYNSYILDLVDQLWPSFLRGTGNNAFWVFGSQIDSQTIDSNNLFGLAMLGHKYDTEENDNFDNIKDLKKQDPVTEYVYDFEPQINTTIKGGRNSKFNNFVLFLYKEIDNCRYALNRYKDELANSFVNFEDVLSKIQRELFSYIVKESAFFNAYLLTCIGSKVCSIKYANENDFPSIVWKTFNLHHYWNICDGMFNIYTSFTKKSFPKWDNPIPKDHTIQQTLLEVWKRIQFDELSVEDRILLTFNILALLGKFYYKHNHDKLMKMVRQHNKNHSSKMSIRIKPIESTLRLCLLNEKLYKEKEIPYNKYCELTENTCEL